MALATTCPQCKTSFRVVPDQLKLRRGFVRCGRCRNVFAGIDHLRYVDDAQLRRMPGVEAQSRTAAATEAEPGIDADAEAARDSQDALVLGYRDVRRDRATDEAEWIDVGPRTLGAFSDEAARGDAAGDHAAGNDADGNDAVGDHPVGDHPVVRDAAVDDAVVDDAVVDDAFVDDAFPDEASAEATPDGDAFVDAQALRSDEAPSDEAERDEAPVDAILEDDAPVYARFADEAAIDERREDEAAVDAGRAGELPADVLPFDEAQADDVLPEAAREDGLPPYVERFTGSSHEVDGADAESAIDYFSTRRARGFADRRGLATGALALALAVALALQWLVAERSAIAARVPGIEPLLGAALAPFGLRIEAPSELDALTIESFELQASAAADVLELRALLCNRADHPVRWPSMQLTLTDPESRVLVRRALHPDDYLAEAGAARPGGVPAHTEWPLRLALEATDLQAAGYDYRVQLFYSD